VEILHEKRQELGVTEIVVLDLADSIRWATPEEDKRIKSYCEKWVKGSVTDAAAVAQVIKGCTTVIHSASMLDLGFAIPHLLYEVNVKGTDNVLAACVLEESVKALVYASTYDVIVHMFRTERMDGLNEETASYALDDEELNHAFDDMYCASKTIAEKHVLKHNKREVERLRTAAVRPVGIYGERDAVHIGSVLGAAKDMGPFMVVRFGDGSAVCQHVYVKNLAWMHVLAAKKLVEGDDRVAGQAFFGIDDTKVTNFWDFFTPYLAFKGYKIPWLRVPMWLAYPLAALTEDIFVFVRKIAPSLIGNFQLKFTRRSIHGTCVVAWFETNKAKRLLGYKPLYTPMESRERTFGFLASRPDLFPQGPYKHRLEDLNYLDDGSDYRPSHSEYLATKKQGKHGSNISSMLFGLGAIGGLAALGLALTGETKRNELKTMLGSHTAHIVAFLKQA